MTGCQSAPNVAPANTMEICTPRSATFSPVGRFLSQSVASSYRDLRFRGGLHRLISERSVCRRAWHFPSGRDDGSEIQNWGGKTAKEFCRGQTALPSNCTSSRRKRRVPSRRLIPLVGRDGTGRAGACATMEARKYFQVPWRSRGVDEGRESAGPWIVSANFRSITSVIATNRFFHRRG